MQFFYISICIVISSYFLRYFSLIRLILPKDWYRVVYFNIKADFFAHYRNLTKYFWGFQHLVTFDKGAEMLMIQGNLTHTPFSLISRKAMQKNHLSLTRCLAKTT